MNLRTVSKDTNVSHVIVITQKAHPMVGYMMEAKIEALRYHLEGVEFIRIERLLGISNTAVIYWVKKAGKKIEEIVFKDRKEQKADILELDGIYVNF